MGHNYEEKSNQSYDEIKPDYRTMIIAMVKDLKSEKFLSQIYDLIRLHIDKGRD